MKKPAVVYVRVSTSKQAEEGDSIAAQVAKIQAWCDFNEYVIAHIHQDAGISGSSVDHRPGLEGALKEVEALKSKQPALIVYSLSRLARNTRDTLDIADRLERSGADLVSLSEKIDTTSAAGKMVFRMLAVLAEFERDQISERTSMVLQNKKTRNERVGAVPYGMKVAEDGVHLIVHDVEQHIIALVLKMHSQGEGLSAIAKRLDELQITTRKGGSWHPMQIHRIIANAE